MDIPIYSLITVFIVITIVPVVARRLRIPTIVLEIIAGVIVGRSVLDIIPEHSLIEFFSTFGLVYLLFLVGLEINVSEIGQHLRRTISIAAISLAVPFLAGLIISPLVDIHPLLLGTIFSTSSVGIILPLTRSERISRRLKDVLIPSLILVEGISIFLLSFSINFIRGDLQASFIASLLGLLLLFIIPWLLRRYRVREYINTRFADKGFFDLEIRLSFALILILGAIAQQLGFEGILGAFLAGLIMTELTNDKQLGQKLSSFGYGFFIPLFFVFTGARIDLGMLFQSAEGIWALSLLIIVGMGANIIGVAIVGLWQRIRTGEAWALGLFHATLTSLTIAAADIASREHLITEQQFSMFVVLAITTAIIGPTIGRLILSRIR